MGLFTGHKKGLTAFHRKPLKYMARPGRFELPTKSLEDLSPTLSPTCIYFHLL